MSRRRHLRTKVKPHSREVTTLELSDGTTVAAAQAVCPICQTLDLNTDFENLGEGRWRLTCPAEHQWEIHL